MPDVSGFSVARAAQPLLAPTDLDFPPGGITLILGPSGSGKTSLLLALAGIGPRVGLAVTGRYRDEDGRHDDLAGGEGASGSLVFQNAALYDDLSVADNLALVPPRGSPADAALIDGLLDGIDPASLPGALSGGQRQRVAIARSLRTGARLILMDEPNAGLDPRREAALVEIVRRLADGGRHVVLAVHHHVPFLALAPRTLFLAGDGRLKAVPPEEIDVAFTPGATDGPTPGPPGPRPTQVPERRRIWWIAAFFMREVWGLVFAPSTLLYIGAACAFLAFTTGFVAVTRYPLSDILLDLTIERLVAEIGEANARYSVPLFVAVLVAARSGALATTDLSMKRFTGATLALEQLRVPIGVYRGAALLAAMALSMLVLTLFALVVTLQTLAAAVALATAMPLSLTRTFVVADLIPAGAIPEGWGWILAKTLLSGCAVGLISLALGHRAAASGRDITDHASQAVLATVLAVIALNSGLILWELAP